MSPSTVQGAIHNPRNNSVFFTEEETEAWGQRTPEPVLLPFKPPSLTSIPIK